MTPCERLPSIFEHGAVLSRTERQRQEIPESDHPHYWGAAGRREAFADYVCCAFMTPWGMCKQHREEFAIIVFRAEPVCCQEGTLFCPTNSARSENTVDEILSMSDIDAFNACFQNPLTRQAFPQAEILVRGTLSLAHAEGIVFCDEEARDYWLPKLRQAQAKIPPEVRSQMRALTVKVRQFDGFGFPNDYVIERRVRE